MGRLVYSMNVSLDGFVETADHSLEWADVDEEVHGWFNDRAREAAAFLYGRGMYETMAGYWPAALDDPRATPAMRDFAGVWNATPKVVFSKTLESVIEGCRLVRGDLADELARLRSDIDGELQVGGATLAASFIRLGLVDAYELVVHPVVLGGGTPFFPPLETRLELQLVDSRSFTNGAALLAYTAADRS